LDAELVEFFFSSRGARPERRSHGGELTVGLFQLLGDLSIQKKRHWHERLVSTKRPLHGREGNRELRPPRTLTDARCERLYRLVKLDLLLQVQLHDPVVVIDTVTVEVVHLRCGTQRGETRYQVSRDA